MEVIILAGGKGTRLQSVVSDVPKPMALVVGVPFLEYQLQYLIKQQITKIVISVGYKSEVIIDYFKDNFHGISIVYAVEGQPLGTGGAILNALRYTTESDVIVINGDTYCPIDYSILYTFHNSKNAGVTLALNTIESNGRYGGVNINKDYLITGFMPKNIIGKISINAGIYIINASFYKENCPNKPVFSFEEDFLSIKVKSNYNSIYGKPYRSYFIDIGVPEDYFRSQKELLLHV